MAYGSPGTLDEVEAYYTHIRGGRTPSPESIAALRARYERVGGRTPLLDITRQLQDALSRAMSAPGGLATPVYVGMKHWHPFISDTVREMRDAGVTRVTAIPLAPHYSRMSIGGYRKALEQGAADAGADFSITFVSSWHRHPAFVAMVTRRVGEVVADIPSGARATTTTLFTAHSLPERIRSWNDPYERELAESASTIAGQLGLDRWGIAWQSAGATGEPWIGPDILDVLGELAAQGATHVVVAPIGFTCDHLEILYDLDVEAAAHAQTLGLALRRIAMPNATEEFVQVLARVAGDATALAAAGPS